MPFLNDDAVLLVDRAEERNRTRIAKKRVKQLYFVPQPNLRTAYLTNPIVRMSFGVIFVGTGSSHPFFLPKLFMKWL